MNAGKLIHRLCEIGFIDVGNNDVEAFFLKLLRLTQPESSCLTGDDNRLGFVFFHAIYLLSCYIANDSFSIRYELCDNDDDLCV